jgi:F-type H+-transporting ATPase subunit delta
MTSRTAATRYAKALFDVAVTEKADLDDIAATLGAFSDLVARHELLARALFNPAVPTPRKRATVDELLKQVTLPPIVAKLLILLAERDRFVILSEIVDAYRQRLLDHQNIVRAEVTTAAPLDESRTAAIEKSLVQATGRQVRLSTAVDPALIGGVVTRIGSSVYDGSIAGQLARMKKRLEEGA